MSDVLTFGPYTLDSTTNQVRQVVPDGADKCITLTPFETRVLGALAKVPGQTVLREELETALRDGKSVLERRTLSPQSNCLQVFVRRLRRKLDPDDVLGLIVTIRGRGYALRDWPVVEENEQAAA